MSDPLVSIILPTWNRERFIAGAMGSIAAQTLRDWELIVVDDGSTDGTRAAVESFQGKLPGQVRYIYRENGGPAAARNTGIDHARGKYLAFFDSDDLWLPHHLAGCVEALEKNPDVDWVFGAGRREEIDTGRVIVANSFYRDGGPRPFLSLQTRKAGPLAIVTDPGVIEHTVEVDHCGGLQASVIRRTMFDALRIPPFRVGEDFALAVRALAAGHRIGYLMDVHVIYRIHGEQISNAGAADLPYEKRLKGQHEYLRAIESLAEVEGLGPAGRRALRRRLAKEYFWRLGYMLHWQHGRRDEALIAFQRGLACWPWNFSMWKTLAACRVKRGLGKAG